MKIAKTIVGIALLQVRPGSETSVCKSLKDYLKGLTGNIPEIYIALSEYDIIAIVELGENTDMSFLDGFAQENVRDYQHILCFDWEISGIAYKNKASYGSSVSVSFIKLEETEQKKNDTKSEKNTLKRLSSFLKQSDDLGAGFHCKFLSTLGWPEICAIQTSENLETLLKNVRNIVLNERIEGFGISVIHTICGIKWDEGSENELKVLPISGNLNWVTLISCVPSALEVVKRTISEYPDFGKYLSIEFTYGKRDIFISPLTNAESLSTNPLLEINQLMAFLLRLRNSKGDLTEFIIASQTQVAIKIEQDSGHELTQSTSPQEVNFNDVFAKIDDFTNWEKTRNNITVGQGPQLKNMALRLSSMATMPGLESDTKDFYKFMVASVNKGVELISRFPQPRLTEGVRKAYFELEEIQNVFFYGLEQRLPGALLGFGNPSRTFSGQFGMGIHRILGAAEAISVALMEGFEGSEAKNWWGFTVFGYQNETFAMPSGAINLPYSDVFCPENWWRLGHETGHAFILLVDMLNSPIFVSLENELPKERIHSLTDSPSISLLYELIVSVFEYRFCFNNNYEIYISTVWQFLNQMLEGEENPKRITEYVFRSAFVFLYHLQRNRMIAESDNLQELVDKGKAQSSIFDESQEKTLIYRAFGEESSLESIIGKYVISKIREVDKNLNYPISLVDISNIVDLLKIFDILRVLIDDLFEQFSPQERSRGDLNAELSDVYNQLSQGSVLEKFNSAFDIFKIPLALNYGPANLGKPLNNRARIAALVTLWNWGRQNESHVD